MKVNFLVTTDLHVWLYIQIHDRQSKSKVLLVLVDFWSTCTRGENLRLHFLLASIFCSGSTCVLLLNTQSRNLSPTHVHVHKHTHARTHTALHGGSLALCYKSFTHSYTNTHIHTCMHWYILTPTHTYIHYTHAEEVKAELQTLTTSSSSKYVMQGVTYCILCVLRYWADFALPVLTSYLRGRGRVTDPVQQLLLRGMTFVTCAYYVSHTYLISTSGVWSCPWP